MIANVTLVPVEFREVVSKKLMKKIEDEYVKIDREYVIIFFLCKVSSN